MKKLKWLIFIADKVAETVRNDRHCKDGNLQSDDGKPNGYKDK